MKRYDAIIIGFGKGGKLLAVELANRNWKVAVIERSPDMYGGTCINVGCIPTKTMINESEFAERIYQDDYKKQSKLYSLALRRKDIRPQPPSGGNRAAFVKGRYRDTCFQKRQSGSYDSAASMDRK